MGVYVSATAVRTERLLGLETGTESMFWSCRFSENRKNGGNDEKML